MNASQLINQTSGEVEYYTPVEIIDAAKRTMWCITLDPASSPAANAIVGALYYFTQGDDGLSHPWFGNVWMNHPFSRENNPRWINKLVAEYKSGRVTQACCITYAATSEAWFQPLYDFPMCLLSPRTNYRLPDGTIKRGVSKGSVVTYLGPYWRTFAIEFRELGRVMLPFRDVRSDESGNEVTP